MIYFTLNGTILGLTAGLSPGPLMTLLIAESLRGGWPAGFRVSFAPLVTDTVLILVALLLTAPLPGWGLSAISAAGGLIIMWMGWGTMRTPAKEPEVNGGEAVTGNPFGKAVATNLLNPNAFLFWLTAGVPILRDAYGKGGPVAPLLFMAPFFGVMIAINLIVSYGIGRGRHFLRGAGYQWTLRGAGLLLLLLGAWRAWEGLSAFL